MGNLCLILQVCFEIVEYPYGLFVYIFVELGGDGVFRF